MKLFLKYLLVVTLIVGISEVGIAQKKHRQRARTAIKELKEGILIVTIPTFQKKIDTLESLIKREDNEKERLWLGEQLAKTKKESNLAPTQIQESFRLYYDFSEVLFMEDTSTTHLKSGNYKNIFLNQGNVNLKGRNFFVHKPSVLRTSNLLRDATVDKDFVPLEPPFPHIFRRRNSIKDYYDPKEKYVFGERYVKTLNRQFWNYYANADNRKWWHLFTREWAE